MSGWAGQEIRLLDRFIDSVPEPPTSPQRRQHSGKF
jgi:hypothetical protein